jgi:UDP-2,3-diacylglucosamine pyrophosphatase LpxH
MNYYRSVFISDVHLGTRMSQPAALLDFIKTFECERLYLVGDIIDGWAMSKSFYWPQEHNDVIQKIMRMARKGTLVTYLPGNHDEFLRSFGEHHFGNIVLVDSTIHRGLNGKNYLIIHGDQFDVVMKNMKWLAHIGSWAYDMLIAVNVTVNKLQNIFKLPHWSLSAWAKYKVKQAVNFIGEYEENLAKYARNRGASGIICGHIHHANIRDIGDITYMNCGDWCESCTALVEDYSGRWFIIKYQYADNPSN